MFDASQSTEGPSAPQKFVVRPALPEDVQAMASLDRAMWQDWANPVTMYRQVLELFPDMVFVAHHKDGRYAGCVLGMVRSELRLGWVLSIDIAEQFRGQGLGKLFLTELLMVFARLPIDRIVAIIDPDNEPSQRLFGAFGFQREELVPDYFGPGKDQERWVL